MLISILITIIGIFLVLTVESFSTALLGFSVAIIVILILKDKVNWKRWGVETIILTILMDILLHRVIGVTLLVVAISCALLSLLFLVIPKKQVILSYVPYFFAFLIFYLLLDLISPFVQDVVWGSITLREFWGYLLKSLISTLIIFFVNTVIGNFRSKDQLTL